MKKIQSFNSSRMKRLKDNQHPHYRFKQHLGSHSCHNPSRIKFRINYLRLYYNLKQYQDNFRHPNFLDNHHWVYNRHRLLAWQDPDDLALPLNYRLHLVSKVLRKHLKALLLGIKGITLRIKVQYLVVRIPSLEVLINNKHLFLNKDPCLEIRAKHLEMNPLHHRSRTSNLKTKALYSVTKAQSEAAQIQFSQPQYKEL